MTSTARQLRQPPTIEAIERVPYFADVIKGKKVKFLIGFPNINSPLNLVAVWSSASANY